MPYWAGTGFTELELYHLLCIRVSSFGQNMESLKLLRLIRIFISNSYMSNLGYIV
ncbi:hypothetical protein Ahy_B04g069808 isoform B [Arachis hypogaea]|uniref:Uncharacterized protein n=1 Tax=Arachis hypogaea TaxID=3818 RepID=A0A444ZDL5_ARAHY|nr:hypothetical protein Ahy_B04g069808 isoform B [Arachis hypogaea]